MVICFFFAMVAMPFSSFASPILNLLQITPSEESRDYVANKKQFQLHELLTEQRHPKTGYLSSVIKENTLAGIEALLTVDKDICNKLIVLSQNCECLDAAVKAVERAILNRKKIYIYGCGATGRLAKQMESAFWRPFWKKLQRKNLFPNIEERLIGEMTGGDRALISSLEGFEDLLLIGKLQLEDHDIQAGDAVFAITEGGETSSVIGTILAASSLYAESVEARQNLFFIYNNPDEVLLPFDRSRAVLENGAISKIGLCTGPQALAGSTRMQATTIQTFVMGIILEQAIQNVLKSYLSIRELIQLGFEHATIRDKLLSFLPLQETVWNSKEAISRFVDLEAFTYLHGHFSTYYAKSGLLSVFTDATERSPTFKLHPFDPVTAERKSWIQVWTPARDQQEAWLNFLGRPFRGLSPGLYEKPFQLIDDPYLQKAALASLKNAGDDQQLLYDFSFASFNIENRGPLQGDLGALIIMSDENLESFQNWLDLFSKSEAGLVLISVADKPLQYPGSLLIHLPISDDPFGLRQHIGLKMMLNAHSTGVMAKLGRVTGNTMTNVKPGNLKLIGRATYLIYSHVNDSLPEKDRISYAEANAILFDAMRYTSSKGGQISEVALSIIRILAILKGNPITWEEAEQLLREEGLKCINA